MSHIDEKLSLPTRLRSASIGTRVLASLLLTAVVAVAVGGLALTRITELRATRTHELSRQGTAAASVDGG